MGYSDEPGMWVVMGTSTAHVVCPQQKHIFNTSFTYLFWVSKNKNGKCSVVKVYVNPLLIIRNVSPTLLSIN